jgi:hypothetical protein
MTTLRPGSIAEAQPRASSSSSRSRLTEADFEAALAKADTLYLSGGPNLEADGTVTTREEDAPDPIEKRSFEQDYRSPKLPSPGVIPPTPSPSHTRRDSRATIASTDSATKLRFKQLKAIGLDGGYRCLKLADGRGGRNGGRGICKEANHIPIPWNSFLA